MQQKGSEGHTTKTFTKNLLSSEYQNYADIPEQILTLYASIGRDGTEQYTNGSYAEVWFKGATMGPGTATQ